MGANFMKTLHATKRTRFMAIAGVSAYYRTSNEIDWDQCRDVSPEEWEANPNIDPCEGLKHHGDMEQQLTLQWVLEWSLC